MTQTKKRMALVLAVAVSLSFTACSGGMDPDTRELETNTDKIYCFDDSIIAVDGYDEDAVNSALTEFALRLFEQDVQMEIADGEKDKNVLLSPTSVITALGMTTYGAKGETKSEMEELFGVSCGYLNHYNSNYMNSLSKEIKIANSIWFTNDGALTVNDAFLQFNEEFYGAEIYETAFNEATVDSINHWVEQNTDGMIKDIIDEIPPDSVMYLVNALAFDAEWAVKYLSTDIRENMTFTNSKGEKETVDMMCSEENYYFEDAHAKGFLKYYKAEKYAFVALLPEEGMEVLDYVKTLSGESLQQMLANPVQTTVEVKLPQFSYEYGVQMKELLEEMGMVTAFDSAKADFSDMATSTDGNIYMNRVIHKTFIEVSPNGTKAGAATLVEMNCESAPAYEEVKTVNLDRPFLYMIVDSESLMPVFIGMLNSVEK